MDKFSWADSLRAAVGSCLPCFKPATVDDDDDNYAQHAAHRDELEGLLESQTDNEADAMSLHSNVGATTARGKRKKRSKGRKSVKLFGFDLFGKPLPEPVSDDEEIGPPRGPRPTISTSTLDSDAAPVPDSAIENLARGEWPTPQQTTPTEEEARLKQEKELRRQKRREKRELKRVAAALAAGGGEDDEFEGFPGSGSRLPHSPQSGTADEFGPFKQAGGTEQEDDDDADFGGEYMKKTPSTRSGGSGSGSHSRSRSIASGSQSAGGVPYHLLRPGGLPSPHLVPLPPSSSGSAFPELPSPQPQPELAPAPTKRKSTKTSKSAASNQSHASVTSTSASLPSPPLDPSPMPVTIHEHTPTLEEERDFRGYPGPKSDTGNNANGFPSTGFSSGGGFPSTGFSGRKHNSTTMNAAALLARRGED